MKEEENTIEKKNAKRFAKGEQNKVGEESEASRERARARVEKQGGCKSVPNAIHTHVRSHTW